MTELSLTPRRWIVWSDDDPGVCLMIYFLWFPAITTSHPGLTGGFYQGTGYTVLVKIKIFFRLRWKV